jgi:tetratricopeptide (TPR) repeat protein
MASLIPVLVAVLGLVFIVFLFVTLRGRFTGIGGGGKANKGREAVLKSASKRLEQNPNDLLALAEMGDLYYREENWEQSFRYYGTLIEIRGLNDFETNLRWGMSALKLGNIDDAFRGLNAAKSINANNFHVVYNLGLLEFQRKNYEKAIQHLNQARIQAPDNAAALRTLGHSYFRMRKNKEAMTFIRKAIDLAPDDKESLFTLAECYFEANQTDQALRVFNHLRGDPVMGPSACLTCGNINLEARRYDKAIQDYEIGLRHDNIKPEVKIELRYRLASCYLKGNDIAKALSLLKSIQAENPTYKDVTMLIGKYQELNVNKNLQIYLMAPSGDFVALCRKIVMGYFPKAKVKITNISVNKNEWADLLAEVDTPKWTDMIMFRFIRSQGAVGELTVRDFHSHIKEVKASKGICVAVGTFTEEARRYTEARLIDLIEKEKLSIILNNVDARVARAKGASAKK